MQYDKFTYFIKQGSSSNNKKRYIAMALALRHDDALLALAGLLGRLITELCSVCVCVCICVREEVRVVSLSALMLPASDQRPRHHV